MRHKSYELRKQISNPNNWPAIITNFRNSWNKIVVVYTDNANSTNSWRNHWRDGRNQWFIKRRKPSFKRATLLTEIFFCTWNWANVAGLVEMLLVDEAGRYHIIAEGELLIRSYMRQKLLFMFFIFICVWLNVNI